MNYLWNTQEVLTATLGRANNNLDWSATGVSIDSRTIEKGDLFIAINGKNNDGHNYLSNAFENGASAALVTNIPSGFEDYSLVQVKDTKDALYDLGKFARKRSNAKIIGLTGSVGKTSTKEALKVSLQKDGPTHANIGNLNNEWGLPLTLARLGSEAKYGIFEIGMSAAGEIKFLTNLLRPNIAIITNVEAVHLEFFNSIDEIAEAKSEIFTGLDSEGVSIINRDSPYFQLMNQYAKNYSKDVFSFGENKNSDIQLIKCVLHDDCSCISVNVFGEKVTLKIGMPGRHFVQNSLAVLGAVKASGGDLALACLSLASLKSLKGRGERKIIKLDEGHFELIDESYNASPASMNASISFLKNYKLNMTGRKIVALGDMLELGPKSNFFHEELVEIINYSNIDIIFCAGDKMKTLADLLSHKKNVFWERHSKDLIPYISSNIKNGDILMVKGSLGSGMQIIVDYFMNHSKIKKLNKRKIN